MRENRVLVLPVNIYIVLTMWRAPGRAGFTWPHDTLLCVLIPLPGGICLIYALARRLQAQGRGHMYQANPDCQAMV